jgi:hypothetical protein
MARKDRNAGSGRQIHWRAPFHLERILQRSAYVLGECDGLLHTAVAYDNREFVFAQSEQIARAGTASSKLLRERLQEVIALVLPKRFVNFTKTVDIELDKR